MLLLYRTFSNGCRICVYVGFLYKGRYDGSVFVIGSCSSIGQKRTDAVRCFESQRKEGPMLRCMYQRESPGFTLTGYGTVAAPTQRPISATRSLGSPEIWRCKLLSDRYGSPSSPPSLEEQARLLPWRRLLFSSISFTFPMEITVFSIFILSGAYTPPRPLLCLLSRASSILRFSSSRRRYCLPTMPALYSTDIQQRLEYERTPRAVVSCQSAAFSSVLSRRFLARFSVTISMLYYPTLPVADIDDARLLVEFIFEQQRSLSFE